MRSFRIINGLMLGFAFGTAGIAILAADFADLPYPREEGRPAFARLIRSEKKTFFGYDHYYFTCLLREGAKERRFTEAVRSDLYNLKREGDNVEVILFDGDRIQLKSNDLPPTTPAQRPLLWISGGLVGLALLLLLLPSRTKTTPTKEDEWNT